MSGKIPFQFEASCWKHEGKGSWHFVSVPHGISNEIRELFKSEEQGWGRLKAEAQVGETTWSTAIWFDTKRQQYLLPLKSVIRQKEKIHEKSKVIVDLLL